MKKILTFFCFLLLTTTLLADEWRRQPGNANDIAIGSNGKVWIVTNTPSGNGFTIKFWNAGAWSDVDGNAIRIAVDPLGNPWIINNLNQIFRRVDGRWVDVPGRARDIGIGANGAVWIIGEGAVGGGYSIHNWNGTSWTMVVGGGTRISVGPNGQPFIVNAAGNIFERNGDDGSWKPYPGIARDISVGANGVVWVIGTGFRGGSYSIHKWNVDTWEEADGGGTQIAVDPAGMPYITNHLFEIYKRTYTTPAYQNNGAITAVTSILHNYPVTGRIESIAQDPTNNNNLMVASCGGVFETRNANAANRMWDFSRSLNTPFVQDIIYSGIPSFNIAWAAVGEEFSNSNTPQIWEKKRTGQWVRAEFPTNLNIDVTKTSAYRVINGAASGIYYACGDFGVAYFYLPGSWKIFSNLDMPVYSIACLKNGTIAAGTSDGIYVYSQSDDRWILRNTNIRFTNSSQRYQLNSDFSGQIFLATSITPATGIQYSSDGISWASVNAQPAYVNSQGSAAGGFISVYMDSVVSGNYSIIASNTFGFYQANISGANPLQAIRSAGSLNWGSEINPGHPDTRHFLKMKTSNRTNKIVMTSDGGFHLSSFDYAAAQSYSWQTERLQSGLNNLEIYNVTGTSTITNFGTQHNGLGAIGIINNLIGTEVGEGYVISRRGFGDTDPRGIAFVMGQSLSVQGPFFGTPAYQICGTPHPYWRGPNDGWGNPIWFGNRIYIQDAAPVAERPGIFPWKISYNNGCLWQSLPDAIAIRKSNNAYFSIANQVQHYLYVGLGNGTDNGARLGKLANPSNITNAAWSYPLMNELNGGIAIIGADFYYNPIFCVNPVNPSHIIALEANTYKLKVSNDGGNNWVDAVSLNNSITNTAGQQLKSNKGTSNIRSIAFSPYDPNIILVGTFTAGLFISKDGGVSWNRSPTPGLINITDFHWQSPNSIIISSYGHGLWKMTM